MRDDDVGVALGSQFVLGLEKRTVELDSAQQLVGFAHVWEIIHNSLDEVLDIDADLHEHVHDLPSSLGDGHQTGVPVMHQQIAVELITGDIIDATGPVGHIAQDDRVGASEQLDDVADDAAEQHQSFRKLQRYIEGLLVELLLEGVDAVDGLLDLEVVVGWQEGDRLVELVVVQVLFGHACDYFGLLFLGFNQGQGLLAGFLFWLHQQYNIYYFGLYR